MRISKHLSGMLGFLCVFVITLGLAFGSFSATPKELLCANFDCLEHNKNRDAVFEGKIVPFVPNKRGKGAGHMYWQWTVRFSDGISIPVVGLNLSDEAIGAFVNKRVRVKGLIFYGVVIGSEDGQAAIGYRIDAESIEEIP